MDAQKNNKFFNLKDFGQDRKDALANLFFKNIIESEKDLGIDIVKTGLSIDLSHNPTSKNYLNKS